MAEWTEPEQLVRDEISLPDKDDSRSRNDFASGGRLIHGDSKPGASERQQPFYPIKGAYVRCPGCGGKVIMPCKACSISNITVDPAAFQRLLDKVPADEAREEARSEVAHRRPSRARPVS